ncbi:MAG: sulfatase [Actinomycetota bacterium]
MRPTAAVVLALGTIAASVATAGPDAPVVSPDRPNVILVVSDDQTVESLEVEGAMPYLQSQLADPDGGWTRFPNTFATTPLCCPARATLLTGRTSAVTGVLDNNDGARLDPTETIATQLHEAGYATALVGKYLNDYPFPGGPVLPPGWDRWVAKTNISDETVYAGYTLVVDGVPRSVGAGPWTYSTDVLAAEAAVSIASMPPDRPFFLWFSPSAPHRPWTPAPRHAGTLAGLDIPDPPAAGEADVSDKPSWVRSLPPLSAADLDTYREERRREYETLLGLDDALRTIDDALRARNAFEDTIVLFLTDNGYALGEHRWETKSCPYDVCTRVPLLVRRDGSPARTDERLVANTDIAPTISELAGLPPIGGTSGESLVPLFGGHGGGGQPTRQVGWRDAVHMEFLGEDPVVPRWRAIRTARLLFVAYETGERELYDLAGVRGPADPFQLDDRSGDPGYRDLLRKLEASLPLGGWEPMAEPAP